MTDEKPSGPEQAGPLPFEAGSFVFSKSVIEHTHYPMHLISGAVAALRPGGLAWPAYLNKLIRFSNEVMLLGVGRKPLAAGEGR